MAKKSDSIPRGKTFGEKLGTLALTRAFPYKRELLRVVKERVKEFKTANGSIPYSIDCIPSADQDVVCTIVVKSTGKAKK